MDGPKHFREAERLGRTAQGINDPAAALVIAQLATMHATLALAAATAGNAYGRTAADGMEWAAACSIRTPRSGEAR